MKLSRSTQIFILFVLVAIAWRSFSFFSSMLDHDESTYLIIGRDLVQGKALYVDMTDTKPVGIFAIYAVMQLIFGSSIFLKRLFVAAVVGATAYLVKAASEKLFQNRRIALASGFIYIFLSSTWNYFGLSPNAELFFNFTTVCSLLLFLKKSRTNYLFAGLLMGIGFMIKYLVLLDFVAIASFLLIHEIVQKRKLFRFSDFVPYFLSGIGFLLPFLLVNLYFYLGDHFQAFRFITYDLPQRYRSHATWWQYFKLLLDFTGRFFPVTFLFFYVLFSRQSFLKGWKMRLLVTWTIAVLIAIFLPGRGFSHYAIQVMLPVSLVAGVAFHPQFKLDKLSRIVYQGKYARTFLIILVVAVQVSGISGKLIKTDKPRVVARYLRDNMGKEDDLFVSNYEHVLYYLLNKQCPTRYVHATILTSPDLASAFEVNPTKEIERIVASRPTYIIVKQHFELVQDLIQDDYSLEKSFFNGEVLVYRKKD